MAKKLALMLDNASIVSVMTDSAVLPNEPAQRTGIIFPVYAWGVPAPVSAFVKKLAMLESGYLFAVATNAGQVANTLVQFQNECAHHGLRLAAGFSVLMPSSYIPWGGPGSPQKCRQLYASAERKLTKISSLVLNCAEPEIEKGPLWQRVVLSYINKKALPYLPAADKKFWVDVRCDSCGICSRVCPADNIQMLNGKPFWLHRCHQCFACLQWCPRTALQWGKRTPRFTRHRPPDLSLQDILKR